MYPIVNFFGKEISTYAICAVVGILIAGYLFVKEGVKNGIKEPDILEFLIAAWIGAMIGGSILYVLTNFELSVKLFKMLFQSDSIKEFFQLLSYIFGGSVFYGGLIGGGILSILYLKIKKLPIVEFTAIASFAVPLFHAFGRLCCFLTGCCFGVECKFGFTYTNSAVGFGDGVSRFPVQLLEMVLLLMLFAVLYYMYKKNICRKYAFEIYIISYGVIRFATEFLRGDEIRGFIGIFSTSQVISIVLVTLAILSLFLKNRSKVIK